MPVHIPSLGFGSGFTPITTSDDADTGIGVGVLRLAAGEHYDVQSADETALLLMGGQASVFSRGEEHRLSRYSLFDEGPSCLHLCAGEAARISAHSAVEVTTYAVHNPTPFAPHLFLPSEVATEHRGRGLVKDACYRFVRTIFDDSSAPKESLLVLGEVVTLPGRWSSYPPHHHPQPEIYHYRFTRPQGYGHAELGDAVLKVRDGDTVKISAGLDHAQCAAPGYGMYYAWVIRHLPQARYTAPEFTEEHRWVMEPDAQLWWPRNVD